MNNGCFAPSLQLVVNDEVLSQLIVIDLPTSYKSIMGHFKWSTIVYDKLKQFWQQLSVQSINKMNQQLL